MALLTVGKASQRRISQRVIAGFAVAALVILCVSVAVPWLRPLDTTLETSLSRRFLLETDAAAGGRVSFTQQDLDAYGLDEKTMNEIRKTVGNDQAKIRKAAMAVKMSREIRRQAAGTRQTDYQATNLHKDAPTRQQVTIQNRKPMTATTKKTVKVDPSVDPLLPQNSKAMATSKLPFGPKVQYLGVLLDAGRHYFPLDWIKRMMDLLHRFRYNLLHFRLTDDQTFNLQLQSHPNLAYPTSAHGETRTYTPDELRQVVAYGKALNITVIPEINIPGHAGAWAGIPGLVVNCPNFICDKAYGVPLNVTSPVFKRVLKDVLQEVLDIFQNPPFLHLGGDEVHMSIPCFTELGIQPFDYAQHEREVEHILDEIQYPVDRVVRWEMTGQQLAHRAGKINHIWYTKPGEKDKSKDPFFVSSNLYFDTNKWDDVLKIFPFTKEHLHSTFGDFVPTAIVAGTFELGTEFWFERNVVGRLIAVAMGAADLEIDTKDIVSEYKRYCRLMSLHDDICDAQAGPLLDDAVHRKKWADMMKEMKAATCERLTTGEEARAVRSSPTATASTLLRDSREEFWASFGTRAALPILHQVAPVAGEAGSADLKMLQSHVVNHTGVIFDLVGYEETASVDLLLKKVEELVPFGFNLIQMKLVDNHGFAWRPDKSPQLAFSYFDKNDRQSRILRQTQAQSSTNLRQAIEAANRKGMKVMAELSLYTNAGGWHNAGMQVACPDVFCDPSKPIVNDIGDGSLIPIFASVIRELRGIFSSDFLHLGFDERQESMACFNEAGKTPAFDSFEDKLDKMLRFEGIDPQNVLRWQNTENTHYPKRFGSITHFRNDDVNPLAGEEFFVTANLFEPDAWTIYANARKLAELKPLGVVADTRFLSDEKWVSSFLPQRLLAYTMAISRLPALDAASFPQKFLSLCEELELTGCNQFVSSGSLKVPERATDTPSFGEQVCRTRTKIYTKRVARTTIV